MTRRSVLNRMLALGLVLALCAPQFLDARVKPSTGFNMFSREQEIQAGQQASAEVTQKVPLVPENDPLSRYVSNLGRRLAANAPGDKWPYSFHVVNQKEINAFALPGGPVYINLGTIQAADNEAQLAGVMAHEISHVVQRHATRAATRQYQAQIPLAILGSLLGGRGGMGAQLAQLGISFGIGSYFLRNSRQAESEADLVGTDIMYDTGYDPHQLAVFFDKLQGMNGGSRGLQFLSDHPDPGNRAAAVGAEVRTLPPKTYLRDSSEFLSMKREAAGMRPLTAQQIAQQPQQGQGGGQAMGRLSRQDVAPSGSFRNFQHQAFRINYPDNWQLAGDTGSTVTIAPRGGMADNAVAYGVIIDGFQPEAGASLDDATRQLIERLRQANPDLRAVGSAEGITVNGVPGKSIDLVGASPIRDNQGRAARERDWLVTLPLRNGDLLYLVFIAPEQDFGTLRSEAFEPMLRSLHLAE